jgi:hypothetical protein
MSNLCPEFYDRSKEEIQMKQLLVRLSQKCNKYIGVGLSEIYSETKRTLNYRKLYLISSLEIYLSCDL